MSTWQRSGATTTEVHRGVQSCRGGAGPNDRPADGHIAAELGIYDSTLGNWVKQAAIDRDEQDGLTR
jgi:hypothetical protein